MTNLRRFNFKQDMDNSDADIEFKKLTSDLGDGYAQHISLGIHNKQASISYQLTARKAEIAEVARFLDEHKAVIPFIYSHPAVGEIKVISESYRVICLGRVYRISTVFKQTFV